MKMNVIFEFNSTKILQLTQLAVQGSLKRHKERKYLGGSGTSEIKGRRKIEKEG